LPNGQAPVSGGQFLAAFCPPAVHNTSTGSGGHSLEESMFSGAFDSAGLESPFHLYILILRLVGSCLATSRILRLWYGEIQAFKRAVCSIKIQWFSDFIKWYFFMLFHNSRSRHPAPWKIHGSPWDGADGGLSAVINMKL